MLGNFFCWREREFGVGVGILIVAIRSVCVIDTAIFEEEEETKIDNSQQSALNFNKFHIIAFGTSSMGRIIFNNRGSAQTTVLLKMVRTVEIELTLEIYK